MKAVVLFAGDACSCHCKECRKENSSEAKLSYLSQMVSSGCGGGLIVEAKHMNISSSLHFHLLQVLGVEGVSVEDGQPNNAPIHPMAVFPDKCGKLKAQVVTNDVTAHSMLQRLVSERVPTSSHLTAPLLIGAEPCSCRHPAPLSTPSTHASCGADIAMEMLDSLVGHTLDCSGSSPPYLAVVGGYGNRPCHVDVTKLRRPSHPLLDAIRPMQSYQLLTCSGTKQSDALMALPVAYYHPDTTRRDTCRRFTAEDILLNGCCGFIHAAHFLSELAYKLGKTPKYGA